MLSQDALSINQIADVLGIDRTTALRKSEKEAWPFFERIGRGGREKRYRIRSLPSSIRTTVAAKVSVKHIDTQAGHGAQAGADLAAEVLQRQAVERKETTMARERGMEIFIKLPEHKRSVANARFEILRARKAYLSAARKKIKAGTIDFCQHYKDGSLDIAEGVRSAIGKKLSWPTINRWQQAYDENGMFGLVPCHKNSKKDTTSLPASQQSFIQALLLSHPGITLANIMEALKARYTKQDAPHQSSVRRFVRKWTKANSSLLLFAANPDEWKNRHMFAFGDASEQVERLNQLWEFDSTPADLMLADGRYSIIGVIDVYSRRFKLLVSPTSKASAIASLTRWALLNWGKPEMVKTDNGTDYVSSHLVRVFEDLLIEQVLCPPFTPECKPHIERAFRTYAHSIVELLPGFIGHSVADRKAIEARRSFADRLMKRGGDPVDCTQLTAAEFQKLCDRWTRAVYEQNTHSGLDGRTPAEMARAWRDPIRMIGNERALDVLLSPAPTDGGMRTVGKKGIKVERTFFIAPELAGHEGERVQVLLDSSDFGTIYVYTVDDFDQRQYLCTAVDPDRTGHDRAEIAARAKALQKQIVSDGARELRRSAKKEATRTIHEEILNYRESLIDNIVPLPQKEEPYTSEALEQAAQAVRDREALTDEYVRQERHADAIRVEKEMEFRKTAAQKERGIVPIFNTATDRYQYIRTGDGQAD